MADKLKILDLLKSCERVIVIAKRFQVNKSTIRYIRQNEDKIRQSAAKMGSPPETIQTAHPDVEVMF